MGQIQFSSEELAVWARRIKNQLVAFHRAVKDISDYKVSKDTFFRYMGEWDFSYWEVPPGIQEFEPGCFMVLRFDEIIFGLFRDGYTPTVAPIFNVRVMDSFKVKGLSYSMIQAALIIRTGMDGCMYEHPRPDQKTIWQALEEILKP